MNNVYEYLANRGITAANAAAWVGRANAATLNKLVADMRELLPPPGPASAVPYRFIANAQLSGGVHPCAAPDCRVRHAIRMSRFAALYAEHVAIQNPLPEIGFANSERLFFDRELLVGSLSVLFTVQPLAEAGLVSLYEPATAFCERHAPAVMKNGRFDALASKLHDEFYRAVTVSRDLPTGWLEIEGPKWLLEHPIISLPREPRLVPTADSEVDERTREDAIANLVSPILIDILQQHVYGTEGGMQYLTDREVDLFSLAAASDEDTQALSYAVQQQMTHVLPTLEQAPIADLLKLRASEGEAFAVYRDSLAKTVRALRPEDVNKVAQAFNDAVLPELNKIDATVAAAQRRLRRSAVTDLLIGTGVVTASIFSGLLSPDIGKAVAQLGGAAFGVKLVQRGVELLQEPSAARDNSYYFLWKAREMTRLRSRDEPAASE